MLGNGVQEDTCRRRLEALLVTVAAEDVAAASGATLPWMNVRSIFTLQLQILINDRNVKTKPLLET